MKQEFIVAFALLASCLVVSVAPVNAATSSLDVGSLHTTDSDFNNAQVLSKVDVVGSGDSASVSLIQNESVDDFDSGGLVEYTGQTGSFSESTDKSFSGGQSLAANIDQVGSSINIRSTSGLQRYPSQGDVFDVRVWQYSGKIAHVRFGVQDSNNKYSIVIDSIDDKLSLRKDVGGSTSTLDSTTIAGGVPSGVWNEVHVNWGQTGTTITLSDQNGVEVASINANDSTFTEGGIGFGAASSTAPTTIYFDAMQIETQTGQYLSSTHAVADAQQAFVNLSLSNVTATVDWQGYSGSQWQMLDSSSYSSTGNYSLDISGMNYDKWRVNVTFDKTGSNPTAQLHDDGILFNSQSPSINNSSMTPADGVKTSQKDETFTINVSDPDFATVQGDSVTATLMIGGQSAGDDTLTSNGTASVTNSLSTGGELSYHWEVIDSYGNSVTSQTRTITVPGTLYLRNVSTSELVSTNTEATARLFSGDLVFKREVTNGKIDLTGLPTDRSYVVKVDSDGYYSRTIAIRSIYDQASIYLLSKNKSPSKIVFSVDDKTGRFSGNPEIYVERGITQNNSTSWMVVAGDQLGATGEFVTDLETGVTYRIEVRNTEGETRILGRYTASGDATAPIPIGKISLTSDVKSGTAFDARLIKTNGERAVRVVYRDPSNQTNDLQLEIVRRDNESIVLQSNITESGPFGRYIATFPVPDSAPDGVSYKVKIHANRPDDEDIGATKYVGDVPEIAKQWNIDAQLLSLMGYVGILAITGLVVIVNPRAAAFVAVCTATLFTWIGVVQIPSAALGIGGATALFFNIGRR